MEDSKSSENGNPEAKLEDDSTRFSKSLQELKDLCSQLHYAADYCETSFIDADHAHKKNVMENTKDYLCRAVVTVVDHLGSVSANLEYRLSNDSAVSETEFRINGLKQRLATCQQYSHQLGFTKVSWNANFARYNPRYICPPTAERQKSMELSRPVAATTISKHEFEAEEEVPLFVYTSHRKPSLIKDSSTETDDPSSTPVLPVRDGLSVVPKAPNLSFHFESKPKHKRSSTRTWKSMQNSDFVSLIRKTKRAM